MLYAAPTSMLMMDGIANLVIRGISGAEPRGLSFTEFFS
jgi:hypothetical protein